ncbi:SdrD B-like domain-containing protein [Microbacterium sp. NPDC089695]|uniref:SdrD B-like domain-containing protein n=1 Tax=Microbacterium sp. NPDC089695 TaxID=3364198 RepID=UPI00382335A8
MSEYIVTRSRARIFTLWLAGILVAMLAVGGLSTPAAAAGGKVTVLPTESGSTHQGLPVLVEGGTYGFQLGYGTMADGQVVSIGLPKGISIPEAALVVPAGNTAVSSLAIDASGQLEVAFRSPFPADVNQGVLDLSFTISKVETSEVRELVWNVDGERTTQRVIVTTQGDSPRATPTSTSKTAGSVTFPHTVVDGVVAFDKKALSVEIPFTVTVSSTDARKVSLTDTLGEGLAFVPGSLAATKTVRDETDLNPRTSPVTGLPELSGSTLTHAFAAEARSVYTFTYRARIADEKALAAVRDRLQVSYDKVDKVDGGSYGVTLTNTVEVNGEKRSTSTGISGSVRGLQRPAVATAFSKTVDPAAVELPQGTAAGTALGERIPVTYTLRADLTVFAPYAGGPFALTRNVVIRDTLSDQISWNPKDERFLVLTDETGRRVPLTPAPKLSGWAESAIAADDLVGTYAIFDRTIYINIGKDVTHSYTLTATATIDALPSRTSEDTLYRSTFRADNNAYFVYADGRYEPKGATTTLIVPKDLSGGVDDATKFAKTTPGASTTVPSGTSATIPYTFTVGANVGDATKSHITDVVDHSVFDVTEQTLPAIAASISGTYERGQKLGADAFDVSLDADGNLVIAPNAAFPTAPARGVKGAAPSTGAWSITVGIPTKVLQGKQTLDVVNAARYSGADQQVVFTSRSTTTATSFGNEMEVRKRVYDAAGDTFTSNLRVETDERGDLAQDEFVYRVELLPHGTFTTMVDDVVDVLPAGVEFVGFVAPDGVAAGTTVKGDRYAIPGSRIVAAYDAEANTVTMERGRLTAGATVTLYFMARIVDHTANVGITNMIGATGATITPTNDYPLSLLKRDSTDSTTLITDDRARFSVLAADGSSVVLGDLRVTDGRIVTAEGETPVVSETGDYWLREDTAPRGYLRSSELRPITVGADGASADVVLFNTPEPTIDGAATYAIGDLVWIDADEDGIQGDDEQVLPGVQVDLLVDGDVVATTTTDDHGRYLFDELAAGEYQVKFTLTGELHATYRLTFVDHGDDDASDSDADPPTGYTQTIVLGADNDRLTRDYPWAEVRATAGIDPTWDAGVSVRGPEVVESEGPGTGGSGTGGPVTGRGESGVVDAAYPGTPTVGALATTGGSAPFTIVGIALFLLLSGASIFFWRRRTV